MSNTTTMDPRTAFDQYLRRGTHTPEVLNEAPSGVGYLLPQHLETRLVNAMKHASVLRPLCTEVTTTGDSTLPVVNGHGTPAWVPDGQAIPIVKDAFDRVSLDSHNLASIVRVTCAMLQESAIDVGEYLAGTFADRLAASEEEAFIAGDGQDKPLGLIHQAKVGCTTETAGSVSIEDVMHLIFSVPGKHRRNGILLMNENTLLQLYKLCAAQGAGLWLGPEDTFFGYRIVRCDAMPDAVPGSTPILFGDFRQVFINNNGKPGIKRLNQLFILNDHIGFLMAERVGIRLAVPDAVKGLRVG